MDTKESILEKLNDAREFLDNVDKSILDDFEVEYLTDSKDHLDEIIDFIEADLN